MTETPPPSKPSPWAQTGISSCDNLERLPTTYTNRTCLKELTLHAGRSPQIPLYFSVGKKLWFPPKYSKREISTPNKTTLPQRSPVGTTHSIHVLQLVLFQKVHFPQVALCKTVLIQSVWIWTIKSSHDVLKSRASLVWWLTYEALTQGAERE